MRQRTMPNTIKAVVGLTAVEVLGPNPLRKAFLLSPMAGGPGTTPALVAVVFNAGAGQTWQVPANCTSIIDVFAWGSGGDSGAAGVALGGGGGGGGGFSTLGPLAVTPGALYKIAVDAHGAAGTTTFANSGGTQLVLANGGANGLLDAAGAGGAAGTGAVKPKGGNGFAGTTLAGPGGGGGGAGGNVGSGGASAGQPGGVGGGAATYVTYGAGGAGGAGGNANVAGGAGVSPGGGGGGGGSTTGAVGAGADGLLVIFYLAGPAEQAISLSPRPDVVVGQGAIQFRSDMTFPFLLTDEDVGDAIAEPWYAISGVANITIQIVEYSYEPGIVEPAY